MKTRQEIDNAAWKKKCSTLGRWYAAVTALAGITVVIVQIIACSSLASNDKSNAMIMTIIHIVLSMAFTLAYCSVTNLLVNSSVIKDDPDAKPGFFHAPFNHGIVIGFGFPYSMFMLAQATFWWDWPLPVFAGIGVTSAILTGMALGGTFLYWVVLSRPSQGPEFKEGSWLKKQHAMLEISWLSLVALGVAGAIITMLMMAPTEPSNRIFSLVILAFTYLVVLSFAIALRVRLYSSHFMLGVLTGATIGVIVINCILVFIFASRMLNSIDMTMSIVALCFQGGLAIGLSIMCIIWRAVESTVQTKTAAGMPGGHMVESVNVPVGSHAGA